MRVRVEWCNAGVLAASFERVAGEPTIPIYSPETAGRIFKLLGIAPQFQFEATSLRPTATYYQRVNSLVSRQLQDKTPIDVTVPAGGRARLQYPAHRVYGGAIGIVSAHVDIQDLEGFPVASLIELRPLNSDHKSVVGNLTKASFSCLQEYVGRKGVGIRYRGRPLYLLELDDSHDTPSDFVRFNRVELAGLLIGNAAYESMHTDIVTSIFDASAELNKKTSDEYLLASKQGLIVIGRSPRNGRRGSAGLYARSTACFELATVCLTTLTFYPELRSIDAESADRALVVTNYLVHNSRAIFNASVSSRILWDRLVQDMSIDALFDLVVASNPHAKKALNPQGRS